MLKKSRFRSRNAAELKRMLLIWLLIVTISLLCACSLPAEVDTGQVVDSDNETDVNVSAVEQTELENIHSEFKEIYEREKLIIAMYSEDRFPYFFVNGQGELVGSDVDLAYDIAHQLGVKEVEFNRSAKTYDDMIDLVAESEVDMAISKISITLNRAQKVLFSEPYFTLNQAILLNRMQYAKVKSNKADPMQLLTSSNVKIGALSGISYIEFARELFLEAEVIPFKSKEDMIQAVLRGDIMAAFYDEVELKRYVNDHPEALLDVQLITIDDRKDALAIAIPPENIHIQEWLKHYFTYRTPLDMDQVLNRYSEEHVEMVD